MKNSNIIEVAKNSLGVFLILAGHKCFQALDILTIIAGVVSMTAGILLIKYNVKEEK